MQKFLNIHFVFDKTTVFTQNSISLYLSIYFYFLCIALNTFAQIDLRAQRDINFSQIIREILHDSLFRSTFFYKIPSFSLVLHSDAISSFNFVN